jgi:hypothetical protein
MIPSIVTINVGDKKYEVIAQHIVNTFGTTKKYLDRTKRIINFFKEYYKVECILKHPQSKNLYFFCNEIKDAKTQDIAEDNIYIKQESQASGSLTEK